MIKPVNSSLQLLLDTLKYECGGKDEEWEMG